MISSDWQEIYSNNVGVGRFFLKTNLKTDVNGNVCLSHTHTVSSRFSYKVTKNSNLCVCETFKGCGSVCKLRCVCVYFYANALVDL